MWRFAAALKLVYRNRFRFSGLDPKLDCRFAPRKASLNSDIFVGDSEIATLLRDLDWDTSPLGPPETWPQSLRSIVRMMLTSRYQMWMGWGPELAYLYNDAYRPTLGVKHP